jgi:two-component system heavy metal sensor histidine kinase CusS
MELALNNLVHNAVKYSFHTIPGSPRVVRIRGMSAGLSYRLMFENYGVGILPVEIAEGRLYEDGYRGELTQSEYRTGAGRGMGFVKRVVDTHHGRIRITSRPVAGEPVLPGTPHLNQIFVYVPYRQEGDFSADSSVD